MSRQTLTKTDTRPKSWLIGGGKMGKSVRSKDWSRTPLGDIAAWPQSLRTTVNLSLASTFPISLAWGEDCVQIYNDGYWPICGPKHPFSMGQDFRECWASAWPVIGESFERALLGETGYFENQWMFLDRLGFLEETCFTFSFSPIRDERGGVGGIFHPVTEVTRSMVGDRRIRLLREMAAAAAGSRSLDEALALTMHAISGADHDLPFAMVYVVNLAETEARLAATTKHLPDAIAPKVVRLTGRTSGWPLKQALQTNQPVELDDLAARFGPFECGPYPEPPRNALLLPITFPAIGRQSLVLVAGVSPRLPLNDGYRAFYELLAGAVKAAISGGCAYQEQHQRAEALAEIDRAKTAFFSNVSHEFRTPLTLMLGPLEEELAEKIDPLPPPRHQRLEAAHRNSLRLLKLVNTLLDFSRIEAGRIQASYSATDLAQLTIDLVSLFRSAVEKAGLALIVECPPLPELVYIDREMWEKIVLNLLSNALKHTFQGSLRVALAWRSDAVELTVADTGIGISEADLPRIFERFHRVHNARSRTHEGVGIGLALARELVQAHGGTLRVESREGHGATFTATIRSGQAHLPQDRIVRSVVGVVADRPQTSLSAATAAYSEEALQWIRGPQPSLALAPPPSEASVRPRILLADDNTDMRQYVSRLLSDRYDVLEVPDGAAAVDVALANPPDLILSDVMMPGLDGFAVLSAVRANESTRMVPVILLSARAGEEAAVGGIDAGADDYLVKPFSARELLARVGTSLRLARLRRESMTILQKRAEEQQYAALHASEERVREHARVIDQAQIIICDLDNRILLWTRGAETLYGFSQAEAIGQLLHQLLNTEFPVPRERLDEILRETGTWEGELTRRKKDGSRVVLASRWVLNYSNGEPARVVKTDTDVTELRKIEAALIQAQKMQAVGTLAGGIAHDFNNLLLAILGNAEFTGLHLPPDHPAHEYISRMTHAGTRAADLVRQILTFSRPHESERKLIQLQPIAEEALKLLRSTLPAMIDIQADFVRDAPCVLADSSQIHQILMNLATNAAHAMESHGGLLEVRLTKLEIHPGDTGALGGIAPGPYLRLSVCDSGSGMDEATIQRIFDPFFTTKLPGKGTGLGLAVVHGIIQSHQGAIRVKSTPGKGTAFHLYLPSATPSLTAPAVARHVPLRGQGERVLCIDDEPSVLAVLTKRIELLGYRVASYSEASSALNAFRANPASFDVILTDLALRGMSGLDLVAEIRRMRQDIPVILMSGHVSGADEERARQLAVDHLLIKPYSLDTFATALHSVLAPQLVRPQ